MGKLRSRRYYQDNYEEAYTIVDADPGTKIIILPGPFVQGAKGNSRNCSVSNFIMANQHLIPHKVYGVQTIKRRVDIIDRIKKGGAPAHVKVYEHWGWRKIKGNDNGTLSERDSQTPLTLRPFPMGRASSNPGGEKKKQSAIHGKLCLNGTLQRAINAGLITREEAGRRRRVNASK